jgi:hypothetical protein
LYGGLAEKKRFAYEMEAALAVGKQLDPSMLNMDPGAFDATISNLKSSLLGIHKSTLKDAIDSLKTLV